MRACRRAPWLRGRAMGLTVIEITCEPAPHSSTLTSKNSGMPRTSDETEARMIHPQPTAAAPDPAAAPPATACGTLSRSLGVGGKGLITLSGISPAARVRGLGRLALA